MIAVPGPSVRRRATGHVLQADTDVLRFEVRDLNRVITSAVAVADLYRPLQDEEGQPGDWQVLVLSCFAVTGEWPPARLAEGTSFGGYRLARAFTLANAGYALWATETFVDGYPDPRNAVHYDLVVAAGPGLISSDLITGDRAVRRAARARLAPLFEQVLELLGEPIDIRPVHEP